MQEKALQAKLDALPPREVLDVKSKRDKTHGQKHLSVLIGP